MQSPHNGDLSGRVAIVTGANMGIGAATARILAARGAAVLVAYLRLDDEPDPGIPETYRVARARDSSHVVESIESIGGVAVPVEADLRDPEAAPLLFESAESRLGPVSILVSNATGWVADTFTPSNRDELGRNLVPVSASTFDQQFAVDARAGALLIAEFARRHAARRGDWGRIIGLTSGGPGGFPGEVSYGAAKAALENYTMSSAVELAPMGVTANIVHPPATDTGWVTESVRAVHPKIARPEDVGEVIAWLASDEARWVTGNVIRMR